MGPVAGLQAKDWMMKKVWMALLVSTWILGACGDAVELPADESESVSDSTETDTDLGSETEDTTSETSGEEDQEAGGTEDEVDETTDEVDETTDEADDPETQPGGSGGTGPGSGGHEDRYECNIDEDGFCIFTGTPHQTGLNPGTNDVVNRDGEFLFLVTDALAANASGEVLSARGTPAFDGDDLIEASQDGLDDDETAFHRVMAIMYPIRNALMYDIATISQARWDELVSELAVRGIKETTFTGGATPPDNYYGRQGVFDLAKNPGGRDIHHDVMKFLEESGLYFLCHVTSDAFNQSLADNHPAGHEPCLDADITTKIPF